MVKGTTASGFKFEVDPEIVKDYEYLELASATSENGAFFPKLINMTLGVEQVKALKEHLRKIKGRVYTEDMSSEYTEIIEVLKNADSDVKK